MAHAFNPNTQEAEAGEALSLRPACSRIGSKATQRNPASKKKKDQEETKARASAAPQLVKCLSRSQEAMVSDPSTTSHKNRCCEAYLSPQHSEGSDMGFITGSRTAIGNRVGHCLI